MGGDQNALSPFSFRDTGLGKAVSVILGGQPGSSGVGKGDRDPGCFHPPAALGLWAGPGYGKPFSQNWLVFSFQASRPPQPDLPEVVH